MRQNPHGRISGISKEAPGKERGGGELDYVKIKESPVGAKADSEHSFSFNNLY